MANTQSPYGFRHIGFVGGSAPSFSEQPRLIASTNATPIYYGDPVVSLNTGYITQATAGTTQIHGIFIGCEYISASRGFRWKSPYWPGSDAVGDVTAWVINQSDALFQVQSSDGGPVTKASIGNNINFALGTGNTATGVSGASVDFATINTTSTLPFRIFGLVSDPPTYNGADPTTAYNDIVVTFNWQDFKSTTGI